MPSMASPPFARGIVTSGRDGFAGLASGVWPRVEPDRPIGRARPKHFVIQSHRAIRLCVCFSCCPASLSSAHGGAGAPREARNPRRRLDKRRSRPRVIRGAGVLSSVHRVPDDDLLGHVVAGGRCDVAVDRPEFRRRERDRDVFLAGALRDPVPSRAKLETVLAGDDEVVGGGVLRLAGVRVSNRVQSRPPFAPNIDPPVRDESSGAKAARQSG